MSLQDSSGFVHLVQLSYSAQLPGGDLVNRFGYNSNVGLSYSMKTRKQWIFSADYSFIFGNQLKETGILDSIRTSSGGIINNNGRFSDVRLYERGFTAVLSFGRLFPVWSPNPNSGFFVKIGAGMMQHKIRIEDIGNLAPQLADDYKKGYDRLTNGFCISQFVGYVFLSNGKLWNFFIGVESFEAFTQSRRSYDYDLMRRDTAKRFDILAGARVGWVLPIYKKAAKEFYYN